MVLQAATLPPSEQKALLAQARQLIAKANKTDPDAIGPLLAYYDSFARTGEQPSDNAMDALQTALDDVPAAPETRLQLAQALAQKGQGSQARAVILPVAAGAYDSPERPAAQTLLDQIAPNRGAGEHGDAAQVGNAIH